MGDVDATIIDVGATEDDILLADGIVLLGIFATVEPGEVHHLAGIVCKVGDNPLLASTHLEGFKTENMPLYLYERHVTR